MYAKLFRDVLTSSLNETEPIEVRGVFFLLLAAADKDGNVLGSDMTIARIINVPLDQFQRCVEALMKPDATSRCELHEGRRLIRMERGLGYVLPAYPKYSGITTDDERREYFRVKKAESRARERANRINHQTPVEGSEAPPVSPEQQHHQNQARIVLAKMSEITGFPFRETSEHLDPIASRLAQPGITIDGCELMIQRQTKLWKGTKYGNNLRPSTLFGDKFDSYYDQRNAPVNPPTPSGNPPRPKYIQPNI